METLTDDNAPSTPAPISQDMGRVFTFAGITLKPFSFNRRVTFFRVRTDDISVIESAILKLFICTQSPAQCDSARGDAASAFRVKAMEWAEKLGIDSAARTKEAMETSDAIDKDLADALSVEPDTKGGSGNGLG